MTGMNPMKRRSFLAGTAGLAATGALAACGSSGAGGGGGEDGSKGGSTVTVWHYFSEDNQVALMEQYKEKFESENDGVTVENVYVPYDQINSKVVNAAGSQTGPDVVVFNGAEAAILALGGGLKPINEEWAAYEDAAQFPDSVGTGARVGDTSSVALSSVAGKDVHHACSLPPGVPRRCRARREEP